MSWECKHFLSYIHRVSVSRRTFGPSNVNVYAWFTNKPQLTKCIWSMAVCQHQFFLDRLQNKVSFLHYIWWRCVKRSSLFFPHMSYDRECYLIPGMIRPIQSWHYKSIRSWQSWKTANNHSICKWNVIFITFLPRQQYCIVHLACDRQAKLLPGQVMVMTCITVLWQVVVLVLVGSSRSLHLYTLPSTYVTIVIHPLIVLWRCRQ